MLKILNDTIQLENTDDVITLGRMRLMRYLGIWTNTNLPQNIKLEADIYCPKKWDFQKSKNEVSLSTTEVPGTTYNALFVESEINCSVKDARKLLMDCTKITQYNPIVDNSKLIQSLNKQSKKIEFTTKALCGTSPRYFHVYNSYFKLRDGSELISAVSTPSDKIPDNYVEAMVIASGYHIIPIMENKIRLIMIYHTELGGFIPSIAINNLIHNDSIKIVENIRDILENNI